LDIIYAVPGQYRLLSGYWLATVVIELGKRLQSQLWHSMKGLPAAAQQVEGIQVSLI
jgi:hypothetical protein